MKLAVHNGPDDILGTAVRRESLPDAIRHAPAGIYDQAVRVEPHVHEAVRPEPLPEACRHGREDAPGQAGRVDPLLDGAVHRVPVQAPPGSDRDQPAYGPHVLSAQLGDVLHHAVFERSLAATREYCFRVC